jgi:hypothetical protein
MTMARDAFGRRTSQPLMVDAAALQSASIASRTNSARIIAAVVQTMIAARAAAFLGECSFAFSGLQRTVFGTCPDRDRSELFGREKGQYPKKNSVPNLAFVTWWLHMAAPNLLEVR